MLSALAWLLLCLCPPIVAQEASVKAPPCPDQAWTGTYRNTKLGFAFTIPAGLKAYWNSVPCERDEKYGCVCLTDFGRDIPLSEVSVISLSSSWEVESDWTAFDLEKGERKSLRASQTVRDIKVSSSRPFRLHTLSARRGSVQFVEAGQLKVYEYVVAIKDGVYYYLSLKTTLDRHAQDKRMFETVIASWRHFVPSRG